jgi:hypothetical protein
MIGPVPRWRTSPIQCMRWLPWRDRGREVIGDGSGEVANQLEQHLLGSTGRSRRGIISAMHHGGVVKKEQNSTYLKDPLPFYLVLNAAEYHDLNPQRLRLQAYLGHHHGHQDAVAVLLHSFLHDDESYICKS